ncbi:MAG TPA: right-handed parallel beta-helix repeat-containing protein [Candidatus Dormibacteraeota bacterium]|jgi:hypothetical protein
MRHTGTCRQIALIAACAAFLGAACGGSHPSQQAARPRPAIASPSPAASPSARTSLVAPGVACPTTGQPVAGAGSLQAALKLAAPGTVIRLAPGIYTGNFVATASGTSGAPITLCGPAEAVIDGGDIRTGYGLHLDKASYWSLLGFSVQNAQKGVVIDHASHVLISGLYVHSIGDEAIHLRAASSDNIVENTMVRDTGHLIARFGEGIYVGSAHSNWCNYTACGPDTSDRNVIRGNDVAQTTAENVDIKEGTTGGVIADNKFSGAGMVSSAATAWVNVKGNGWTITGNTGFGSVGDGFQVHEVYAGWGQHNVFHGNQANVNGPGFGFYVQRSSLGTVVGCDNTATGAAKGLSNLGCAG